MDHALLVTYLSRPLRVYMESLPGFTHPLPKQYALGITYSYFDKGFCAMATSVTDGTGNAKCDGVKKAGLWFAAGRVVWLEYLQSQGLLPPFGLMHGATHSGMGPILAHLVAVRPNGGFQEPPFSCISRAAIHCEACKRDLTVDDKAPTNIFQYYHPNSTPAVNVTDCLLFDVVCGCGGHVSQRETQVVQRDGGVPSMLVLTSDYGFRMGVDDAMWLKLEAGATFKLTAVINFHGSMARGHGPQTSLGHYTAQIVHTSRSCLVYDDLAGVVRTQPAFSLRRAHLLVYEVFWLANVLGCFHFNAFVCQRTNVEPGPSSSLSLTSAQRKRTEQNRARAVMRLVRS